MTGVKGLDARMPAPSVALAISVREVGAPVVATVDQTLIRGLEPHDNSSSEGCLALFSGIALRPAIMAEDSFWSVPMPPPPDCQFTPQPDSLPR